MPKNPFRAAHYLTSAHRLDQLPADAGAEIAFAGRSNAGKSSALNAICDHEGLARTSKTPGLTRGLVIFALRFRQGGTAEAVPVDELRLIDLPGYGYAQVSQVERRAWHAGVSSPGSW